MQAQPRAQIIEAMHLLGPVALGLCLASCVTVAPLAPALSAPPPDLVWAGAPTDWVDWTLELGAPCNAALADLTGAYESTWGAVHLEQRGDRIVGWYSCCGGGTLEGTLTGDLLEFRWTEPGRAGRGIFRRVAPDRLTGSWGWRGDTEGGRWELVRRR